MACTTGGEEGPTAAALPSTGLAAAGSGGDEPPEDPNKPVLPLVDTLGGGNPPAAKPKTPAEIAAEAAALTAATTDPDSGAGRQGIPFPSPSEVAFAQGMAEAMIAGAVSAAASSATSGPGDEPGFDTSEEEVQLIEPTPRRAPARQGPSLGGHTAADTAEEQIHKMKRTHFS